jgi:hypothetical protein
MQGEHSLSVEPVLFLHCFNNFRKLTLLMEIKLLEMGLQELPSLVKWDIRAELARNRGPHDGDQRLFG